jgi:hypothetical protein
MTYCTSSITYISLPKGAREERDSTSGSATLPVNALRKFGKVEFRRRGFGTRARSFALDSRSFWETYIHGANMQL